MSRSFSCCASEIIVGAEEAADVCHAIFLRRHGAAVAVAEHLLRNLLGSFRFVSRFAQLDEVGIFGEAAGVEVERNAVLAAHLHCTARDVFHGNGLAAAGVVGDGQHDQRNAFAAHFGDQVLERLHVHVAFEGMLQAGLTPLGDDEIDGLGADEFDVGARGIEVRVVGNDVALLARRR